MLLCERTGNFDDMLLAPALERYREVSCRPGDAFLQAEKPVFQLEARFPQPLAVLQRDL